MKKLFKFSSLLLLLFISLSLKAQSEDRNNIQMVVKYEGKTITTELTNVGIGITRYKDYSDTTTDAAAVTKEKSIAPGGYYLTMSVKKVNNDLLKLFSKKQAVFSGSITITDSYGKNPTREIKFSNASLESYSDQFSTQSYDDSYSTAAVSLSAKGLTINGIAME